MTQFKKRTIRNPEERIKYALTAQLGEGGFGVAYQATRKIKGEPDAEVCVKLSSNLDGWMTEVHFGKLLKGQPRVIQLYDYFPMLDPDGQSQFVLVSELAKGDVESLLTAKAPRAAFPPKRALSETAALLKTLAMLHSISSVHRDLTPRNVFVARSGRLKLADFGIARVLLPGKKASRNTANWGFVPTGFQGKPKDDVFLMGQLLAKLVTGNGFDPILRLKDLETFPFGKPIEDEVILRVLSRSIGFKKDRYADAAEMLLDIEGDEVTPFGGIRTLRNKKVIFTGPLTIRRDDAKLLVVQSGGKPIKKVSRSLNVVVVGGVSPRYLKGRKGRKLLEVGRLNKEGARIHVIGEAEFFGLVRASER